MQEDVVHGMGRTNKAKHRLRSEISAEQCLEDLFRRGGTGGAAGPEPGHGSGRDLFSPKGRTGEHVGGPTGRPGKTCYHRFKSNQYLVFGRMTVNAGLFSAYLDVCESREE